MLRKIWIELRSSLWFVPTALVLAGVVLALVLVQLDIAFAEPLRAQSWRPWLNAGAEGARGMLTAIASSMITVAGVAFSVTIVTLSLASTQYTPRILRNFMRDRANQFVLGVFVGIFAYCLIVLRTIRGQDGAAEIFVPLLAVVLRRAAGAALDRLPDLFHPPRRGVDPGVRDPRRDHARDARGDREAFPGRPRRGRRRTARAGGARGEAVASGARRRERLPPASRLRGADALCARARDDSAAGARARRLRGGRRAASLRGSRARRTTRRRRCARSLSSATSARSSRTRPSASGRSSISR